MISGSAGSCSAALGCCGQRGLAKIDYLAIDDYFWYRFSPSFRLFFSRLSHERGVLEPEKNYPLSQVGETGHKWRWWSDPRGLRSLSGRMKSGR